jgi:L-asparaginase
MVFPCTSAVEKSMHESQTNGRDLGMISLDRQGNIVWGKTAEILLAAYHDGQAIGDTLEWHGENVGLTDIVAVQIVEQTAIEPSLFG